VTVASNCLVLPLVTIAESKDTIQAAAEEFSTLVHELAHEMFHKAERRTATTKTVRETEVEAIAFVVSQTIGLDAGRTSALGGEITLIHHKRISDNTWYCGFDLPQCCEVRKVRHCHIAKTIRIVPGLRKLHGRMRYSRCGAQTNSTFRFASWA